MLYDPVDARAAEVLEERTERSGTRRTTRTARPPVSSWCADRPGGGRSANCACDPRVLARGGPRLGFLSSRSAVMQPKRHHASARVSPEPEYRPAAVRRNTERSGDPPEPPTTQSQPAKWFGSQRVAFTRLVVWFPTVAAEPSLHNKAAMAFPLASLCCWHAFDALRNGHISSVPRQRLRSWATSA
jgi:hypothetical protein